MTRWRSSSRSASGSGDRAALAVNGAPGRRIFGSAPRPVDKESAAPPSNGEPRAAARGPTGYDVRDQAAPSLVGRRPGDCRPPARRSSCGRIPAALLSSRALPRTGTRGSASSPHRQSAIGPVGGEGCCRSPLLSDAEPPGDAGRVPEPDVEASRRAGGDRRRQAPQRDADRGVGLLRQPRRRVLRGDPEPRPVDGAPACHGAMDAPGGSMIMLAPEGAPAPLSIKRTSRGGSGAGTANGNGVSGGRRRTLMADGPVARLIAGWPPAGAALLSRHPTRARPRRTRERRPVTSS